MAEAAIPVDLFNPGQVFACIGLVEAADVLLGDAEGIFDWSDPAQALFRVRAAGEASPVVTVMAFLDRAQATSVAPSGSSAIDAWKDGWGRRPTERHRDKGYPFPDRGAADTLLCEISDGEHVLHIDHWGDATCREAVKFWAGAGGYPGATRVRDALELGRGRYATEAASDPLSLPARTHKKSSVRLDWRRDYIPIDLGFSMNEHGTTFIATCYPVVEVIGALGLGAARPMRINSTRYEYFVSGRSAVCSQDWLPLPLLRAMLGGPCLPWPTKRFRAEVGRPNDYDRIFTTVTEENLA